MARIESLNEIESIVVHWSESQLINDELGGNEDCDIEKQVTATNLDAIIQRAGKAINTGYDKTSMTVTLLNGLVWAKAAKFYITKSDNSLLNVLNKGE